MRNCTLCPRKCHVDRTSGARGYCRTGDLPFVSSWGPHFGEERPLVGRSGSGTIFFGNCSLGCIFCQNYSISHLGEGREMTHEQLAEIMLSLQESGCRNINLVTPTHQTAAIVKAFRLARDTGLRVPIVYNCGGYESVETLKILEGIVDVYMPDFKYAYPEKISFQSIWCPYKGGADKDYSPHIPLLCDVKCIWVDRRITEEEYSDAMRCAVRAGLKKKTG